MTDGFDCDEELLAEVIQTESQRFSELIRPLLEVPLSSECEIVWNLDGLPEEIRIQANLFAALYLSLVARAELPMKKELVLSYERLALVGDHLNILEDAFGTSEPDPTDDWLFMYLECAATEYLTSNIISSYGFQWRSKYCVVTSPIAGEPKGTEEIAPIKSFARIQTQELLKSFQR